MKRSDKLVGKPKAMMMPALAALGLVFALSTPASRAAEPTGSEEGQDRALIALVAAAFPKPTDPSSQRAVESTANAVVDRLETQHVHERERAMILASLVDALDRAENPSAAMALLAPAVAKLGVDFRTSAAEVQIARGTPQGKALGAMLLQSAASDPAVKTRQQALLAEAVRAAPAHRDVLRIARYYCDSDACRSQSPAHKLAEAEPDNAAHWVLLLERSDTQSERDSLLHRAAAAHAFDDQFDAVARLHAEAIRSAGIAWPEALRAAAERVSDEASAETVLNAVPVPGMPIPAYAPLVDACNPAKQTLSKQVRTDCLAIGDLAAYKGGSLIANMVGSVIIRRLLPGTADYARARELRRHYVYASNMRDRRDAAQVRASRDELVASEIATFGEMEAIKRSLDRAGIPRNPPAGWEPEQRETLMTPDERVAYRAGREMLSARLQNGEK